MVSKKALEDLDWEEVAKEAACEENSKEVWLRRKAEALLKVLYQETSFEACLARLMNTKTSFIN